MRGVDGVLPAIAIQFTRPGSRLPISAVADWGEVRLSALLVPVKWFRARGSLVTTIASLPVATQ